MFKKKMLRFISVALVALLCIGVLASCASNNNDALNGVTGSMSGQISTGGNGAQNNNGGQDSSAGNNQGGSTEEQGGNASSGNTENPGNTETPDNTETPADEEENGEDPYAVMKADKSGTSITIMSQNLRYNSKAEKGSTNDAEVRRYRFQVLMDKYKPDVVGMQECDAFWIDVLQLDYSSEYTLFYHYRDSASFGSGDEATPVMWKTAKYDFVKSGYFWLSKTPNKTGYSYESDQLPRIVNWVTLKDKATGVQFNIYSTHFGFYDDDESVKGIYKQISDAFASHPKNSYSFVMGDFNFAYKERQWMIMADEVKITDLRDVATAMSENGHCTLGDIRKGAYNGFTEDDGGVFGDFIMASPRKKMAVDFFGYCYEKPGVPERGIEPGFVSDHFAVYAEIRVNTDVSYAEYYADSAP